MLQLLAHLWGDYIFQTHWMATNKVKNTLVGWIACLIHCILYTLPFIFVTTSPVHLGIIFGTHFIIDKFRLAKYVCRLKEWNFKDNGYSEDTPAYISIWLLFIVDNIIHVTINYLTIKYI